MVPWTCLNSVWLDLAWALILPALVNFWIIPTLSINRYRGYFQPYSTVFFNFAAGKHLKSGKIPKITGLDPAGPKFSLSQPSKRLAVGDALYVETIHTSKWGFAQPIGDVRYVSDTSQIIIAHFRMTKIINWISVLCVASSQTVAGTSRAAAKILRAFAHTSERTNISANQSTNRYQAINATQSIVHVT